MWSISADDSSWIEGRTQEPPEMGSPDVAWQGLVVKQFWQWRLFSTCMAEMSGRFPKNYPRHPSDQLIVFIWPFVQSKKFMRTNHHEGFCEDDDLLNPPIRGWNGFLREFGYSGYSHRFDGILSLCKKYCISLSVVCPTFVGIQPFLLKPFL